MVAAFIVLTCVAATLGGYIAYTAVRDRRQAPLAATDNVVEIAAEDITEIAAEENAEASAKEDIEEAVDESAEAAAKEDIEEAVDENAEAAAKEDIEEAVDESAEAAVEQPTCAEKRPASKRAPTEQKPKKALATDNAEPAKRRSAKAATTDKPSAEPTKRRSAKAATTDKPSVPPLKSSEIHESVTATEVDNLMRDEVAATYIEKSGGTSDRTKQAIINIDTLSQNFNAGETVTLEEIKKRVKGFSKQATYLKVLARGTLDKPLTVEADSYSLQAVKMIVLTGGTARKR